MEQSVYEVEAQVEAAHWWFKGRRTLVGDLLRREGVKTDAAILDVGTSTGTNLRLLKEMGFQNVEGVDPSEEAIRFCAEKGLGIVRKGDVAALPFEDNSQALILLTDILEHVEDVPALAEVRRVLKPGGLALITVPAFKSMWGLQDDVSHHLRRYTMTEIQDKVVDAGLAVKKSFYFNYLLFFPIWLARQIIRIFKVKLKSENEVNNPLINKILTFLFRFDVRTAAVLRPPFGVSALVMAQKPE